MGSDGKPYRVYKGGRSKGRVPLQRPTSVEGGGTAGPTPATGVRERRPRRWKRWVLAGAAGFGVLLAVWAVLSVLAVSRGVREANARVPGGVKAQLTPADGLMLSEPSTILVLGTDGGTERAGAQRSDSIMLVRTDPGKKRISYLSIPRDLQVSIPDYGLAKINAA